jgi:hypothetical protein
MQYGETVAKHARDQTYKSYQRLVSGLRDNVPSNMRSAVVAERIHGLANKKFGSKGKQLCGGCWLPNYLCVCGAGDALSREAVDAFPHRIIVYMHVKASSQKKQCLDLLDPCIAGVRASRGNSDVRRRLAGHRIQGCWRASRSAKIRSRFWSRRCVLASSFIVQA